jgi:hypothetical protein
MAGIRKSHFHYLSARASAKQQGATHNKVDLRSLGQCSGQPVSARAFRCRSKMQPPALRLINEKFPAANNL